MLSKLTLSLLLVFLSSTATFGSRDILREALENRLSRILRQHVIVRRQAGELPAEETQTGEKNVDKMETVPELSLNVEKREAVPELGLNVEKTAQIDETKAINVKREAEEPAKELTPQAEEVAEEKVEKRETSEGEVAAVDKVEKKEEQANTDEVKKVTKRAAPKISFTIKLDNKVLDNQPSMRHKIFRREAEDKSTQLRVHLRGKDSVERILGEAYKVHTITKRNAGNEFRVILKENENLDLTSAIRAHHQNKRSKRQAIMPSVPVMNFPAEAYETPITEDKGEKIEKREVGSQAEDNDKTIQLELEVPVMAAATTA